MQPTRTRPAGIATASVAGLLVVLAAGSPAWAAPDPGTARLFTIINNATGWLVGIAAAVATLFLTYAGLKYVLAGDNPTEVEKAKTAFKSALRGYAVAVLAPIVVLIIKNILGVR